MTRMSVGTLAREMAGAIGAYGAGETVAGGFAPRILCLTMRIVVPTNLTAGWDPDRYRMVADPGFWSRWWFAVRSTAPVRWLFPPRALAVATLLVATTPRWVRITLDGQRADTSRFNDRRS